MSILNQHFCQYHGVERIPVRDELTGDLRDEATACNAEANRLSAEYRELAIQIDEHRSQKHRAKTDGGDVETLAQDAFQLAERLKQFYVDSLAHNRRVFALLPKVGKVCDLAANAAHKAVQAREKELRSTLQKCGVVLLTDFSPFLRIEKGYQDLAETHRLIQNAATACRRNQPSGHTALFLESAKRALLDCI